MALVRSPVGAECDASTLIDETIQSSDFSFSNIGNEYTVEMHVDNRVKVDSDSFGSDKTGVINVDILGVIYEERPGLPSMHN